MARETCEMLANEFGRTCKGWRWEEISGIEQEILRNLGRDLSHIEYGAFTVAVGLLLEWLIVIALRAWFQLSPWKNLRPVSLKLIFWVQRFILDRQL
jgi:hypothetical protein